MHQTTLRFGEELWSALASEAEARGESVAQYVREAALARLAYSMGRRRDPRYEAALAQATGSDEEPADAAIGRVGELRTQSEDAELESAAVWAQSRQARARSQRLRGIARRSHTSDPS